MNHQAKFTNWITESPQRISEKLTQIKEKIKTEDRRHHNGGNNKQATKNNFKFDFNKAK